MTLYFVTGNAGKLREVQRKFEPLGIEVEQLVWSYPEIQTDKLEDVVRHGLKWLWEKHGQPMMIDDSGLFVQALNDFPGVFSAHAFKTMGCGGILKLLAGAEDREARFECCAGFLDPDGNKKTAKGVVEGRIINEKRGSNGFGYDPIFVPKGHERTFAEMSIEEKNTMSHRGRAFDALSKIIINDG